jgi:DNA polymerase-1
MFDLRFLRWHGFLVKGVAHDTQVQAHLLDENFFTGLKPLTWRYLDFGGYERELELYKYANKWVKHKSYKHFPQDLLFQYAGMDTYATLRLYDEFLPRMQSEGVYSIYRSVSVPMVSLFSDMECAGLTLDREYAEGLNNRFEVAKNKIIAQIREIAGDALNINSPKQLAKYFYTDNKVKVQGKTKKGASSTDAKVLKKIAALPGKVGKVAGLLVTYKKLDKIQGTFISQALEHVWNDGKVRSSVNLCGTVTGRSSNSNPCTFNVPKDRLIRSMYVSSLGCLVEADIKAAEIRVLTVESNEPVFLESFEKGIDIHNQTYNAVFGKERGYVPTDEERRLAKIINFATIYGVTPIGLAPRIGGTVEDAEKFLKMYFIGLPAVAEYLRRVVRQAKQFGYVKSLFGRKRRLPDIQSDDKFLVSRAARQARNSPIQSAAADCTYIGMIRLSRELKKRGLRATIVQSVYDCVVVDTPLDEVDVVKELLVKAFTDSIKGITVRMEVDCGVVSRWGEHGDSPLEELLTKLEAV